LGEAKQLKLTFGLAMACKSNYLLKFQVLKLKLKTLSVQVGTAPFVGGIIDSFVLIFQFTFSGMRKMKALPACYCGYRRRMVWCAVVCGDDGHLHFICCHLSIIFICCQQTCYGNPKVVSVCLLMIVFIDIVLHGK